MPPRKILVIRLSSIGDIVLATLLLRNLRRRYAGATIDMLAKEQFLHLLNCIGSLDKAFAYPASRVERKKLRWELADQGYDTVIDLQNNLISRSITASIKPNQVYRFRRSRINRWIRIYIPALRKRITTPPPVALGYLAAVRELGIRDDGRGLELKVDDKAAAKARELLKSYHNQAGIDGKIKPLIAAPGARHQTKIWLVEHWIEMLRAAHSEGFTSQVLIGNSNERGLGEEIVSRLGFPVLNTAGELDLLELTALLWLGRAIVTSDSGPMHIAAAVSTPVVSIFGSTVPEFGFAPFRCKSEVVQIEEELDCRPCHPHGRKSCPRKHFRCMTDIRPDMVMQALLKVTRAETRRSASVERS
jgi:lipopolysaccharide heptosyltransferase II